MRRSIFLFLIIWISNSLVYAQDQPKKVRKLIPGVSFSTFGYYDVFALVHNEDYPSFTLNSFYSSGISIFLKTNKMLEIESGIYYSFHSIDIDQPYATFNVVEKVELLELPINFRFDLPYFYVSWGFLFDIQLNNTEIIDKQTGIGFNSGLGVSYEFKRGVLVYAGPIAYLHTFPLNENNLLGISLKIGIAFN
jgi:hypothetical protein